jgi:hypothetical protein
MTLLDFCLDKDVDVSAQKLIDDMGDEASLEAAEEILEDSHISQDWSRFNCS